MNMLAKEAASVQGGFGANTSWMAMLLAAICGLMGPHSVSAQQAKAVPNVELRVRGGDEDLRKIERSPKARLAPGDLVELSWSTEIRQGQVIHLDEDQGYFIEVFHVPGGTQRRTFRPRDQLRLVHPGRLIKEGDEVDYESGYDVKRGIVENIDRRNIRVQPQGEKSTVKLPNFDVASVYPVKREPVRRWEMNGMVGPRGVVEGKITSVSVYAAKLEGRNRESLLVPLSQFSIKNRLYVFELLRRAQADERKRFASWDNEEAGTNPKERPPAQSVKKPDFPRKPAANRTGRNAPRAMRSTNGTRVPPDAKTLIDQIRQSDGALSDTVGALVRLQKSEIPVALREDVFAVVGPLVAHERNTVHVNAFRVLQRVGFTSSEMDCLFRAYTEQPRQAATELAQFEDPRIVAFFSDQAAKAKKITDPVFAAVEAVGQQAEPALWSLLEHPHPGMQARARQVLEKIGTARTVRFVQEKQLQSDRRIQRMIEQIRANESKVTPSGDR